MNIPFQHVWRRLTDDPPPGLACEFTTMGVAAARWIPGSPRPERMAVRPLPAGALRAQPVRDNLTDMEAVTATVAAVLEDAQSVQPGRRRREIAILLPDSSARVALLPFEKIPDKHEEALALLKFRLKKTLPFDVDDAALSWKADGSEIMVAVTPRAIVRQYEEVLEHLGYLPGLVTVSTLAGLSLAPSPTDPAAGAMLVRRSGPTVTIALTNRDKLRMMRTTESENESDLFHDIFSSAVFYQDRYAGNVDRLFYTGFADTDDDLWAHVESELQIAPRPLIVPGAPDAAHAAYLGIFGMLAEQAKN